MKRTNLFTFISLFALMLMNAFVANAYDFMMNGIYYDIHGRNVTVTYAGPYWYSGNSYSGDIAVPKNVTYNGTTYTVTKIGLGAFMQCDGLTSVTMPNSIISIEECAFFVSTNITSIDIPNSVISIGQQAFHGCTGLTYVSLGNSVASIGFRAFQECSGLTDITIPNSVTSIAESAFQECTSLTSITIPTSVTSIGKYAFSWCSGLTSISVESGNTKYDSRNYCNAIIETATNTLLAGCMNSTVPNTVTSIGEQAFLNCSCLTNIEIPNSVISIGDNAFELCTGLANIDLPNSLTSIGMGAFARCSNITSLDIPHSVTTIGSSAFSRCSGLTNLTIGKSVSDIGNYAFANCTALTSVTCFATTPPNIGNEFTFPDDVTSQATLYVPKGSENSYKVAVYWENFINVVGISIIDDFEVDGIYYHALSENTAIVIKHPEMENYYRGSVIIPDSVSYQDMQFAVVGIDDSAFEDCFELTSVVIGNVVERIGEESFQGCTGLTNLTIGSGVTTIGAKAFNYCNSLQTITCEGSVPPVMENSNCFSSVAYKNAILFLPDGLIETYAATDYWYKFEKIMGDFEVDGIYYHALTGNTAMVIKHPEIDNYYVGDVIIPDSVSYQGLQFAVVGVNDRAFEDCSELSSAVIGNAVECIGEEAFQGCTGLANLTIGSGVSTIGAKAFNYCNSLQTVTCLGTVPPIMDNSNCFSSSAYRNAILFVPEGLIEAYSAADYWYKFEKIMDHEPAITGDVNGDGEVNIADVNAVIDMILSGSPESTGDVNGDDEVNIADINAVIDIILGGA